MSAIDGLATLFAELEREHANAAGAKQRALRQRVRAMAKRRGSTPPVWAYVRPRERRARADAQTLGRLESAHAAAGDKRKRAVTRMRARALARKLDQPVPSW